MNTTPYNPQDKQSQAIFDTLTAVQKDDLYRMLWSEHVQEDVDSYMTTDYLTNLDKIDTMSREEREEVSAAVADEYVNGEYDCTLPYWSNIENLLDGWFERNWQYHQKQN